MSTDRADRLPSAWTLNTFSADVTIPIGHPCMRGGIAPARILIDPLEAIGFVLAGGTLTYDRTSASHDPAARSAPEGLIDSWLRIAEDDENLGAWYWVSPKAEQVFSDGLREALEPAATSRR